MKASTAISVSGVVTDYVGVRWCSTIFALIAMSCATSNYLHWLSRGAQEDGLNKGGEENYKLLKTIEEQEEDCCENCSYCSKCKPPKKRRVTIC